MSTISPRATLFFIATSILLTPDASFGRGPGGGGPGAGPGAGGRGSQNRQLAKPEFKKKDGPRVGSQKGPAPGGLSGKLGEAKTLQGNSRGLGGLSQKSPGGPDLFKKGVVDPRNSQSFLQRPDQKKNWRTRDGQNQQAAENAIQGFQKSGPQPFTPAFYADHPAAWQNTHPHADAWATASAAGVAAWLGWNAYGNNGYGASYSTTYVYEQPADTSSDNSTDDSSSNYDSSESNTAQDESGQWLALGVYEVQSANGEPTSRYLQLAVDRQGELRGVYYDEISGSSQNISGQVDSSTQVATWSLDSNRQISFRAPLSELTQATGTIEVTQSSGKQQWRIARQQNGS